MRIILVLFILLSSCITNVPKNEIDFDSADLFINPYFAQYVMEFIKDSHGLVDFNSLEYVHMDFDDLSGNTVGLCASMPYRQIIKIDRKWWEAHPSHAERRSLIYHELGHCVLFLDHSTETGAGGFWGWLERMAFRIGILDRKGILPDMCPSSYMHPHILHSYCIEKHHDFYKKEIFGLADVDAYAEQVSESLVQ